MPVKGRQFVTDNKMVDIIKHDYLRMSIEDRVQRKAIQNEYM